MEVKIIFHTETEVIEGFVEDTTEFSKWVSENIAGRGKKLYVVLPGQDAKSALITDDIEDIECYFDFMFIDDVLFIMEFAEGDYADALGYLADLYEAKEPFNPQINNN